MTDDSQTPPINPPDFPLQYRAVGQCWGTLELETESKGCFTFADGHRVDATLNWQVRERLSKQGIDVTTLRCWRGYPKTDKEGRLCYLKLVTFSVDEYPADKWNFWSVRGTIRYFNEEKTSVNICTNRNSKNIKPFFVQLQGAIEAKKGEFWEFLCRYTGEGRLQILSSSEVRVQSSEKGVKPKSGKSDKVVPAASTQERSSEATSTPSPQGDDMTIPGRLSVLIKISEFPDDVVVEGKQVGFTVQCDHLTVIVSVTKKVFKKLEQARDNFPEWVARIEGDMGAATESGFALEKANLQVFEVKPKEPKEEKAG